MYPKKYRQLIADEPKDFCRGGSVIVSPLGKVLAGPLYDKSGVVTAEIDLEEVPKSKLDFDVVGHYARNDIFSIEVKNQPEIKNE